MARLPVSIVAAAAAVLLLALSSLPVAVEARPGCSEKEENAMGESYQKCLNDVNEKSHKEMSKIKSNSDYQVGSKRGKNIRCFKLHFPPLFLPGCFT